MKLVILDRDGVINKESEDFIKSPGEWRPIPGSLDAIARLNHAGYSVAIASNQSGLARGLFSINDLNAIHQKMLREIARAGGELEAILFCPHGPEENCGCRKPKPGLLQEIGRRLHQDLLGVPVVGDTLRDLQAAQAVGAQPILVRSGKGNRTLSEHKKLPSNTRIFDDLADAVDTILEDS